MTQVAQPAPLYPGAQSPQVNPAYPVEQAEQLLGLSQAVHSAPMRVQGVQTKGEAEET